jgi:hypothetical protein
MSTQQILSDLDFVGVSRIRNLPNAVDDAEPATLAQLKAVQENSEIIDYSGAVDGSVPIYSSTDGKFVANQLNTKLTITDGGNF